MTEATLGRREGLAAYRHLWTPPEAPGGPVLALLHGTGGDAAGFDSFGAGLARAGSPGAGRLALEGDVSEFGAARFFRRQAEGVYDRADLAARTAKFDRFLGDAAAAYSFSLGQAVGVGYSNGANLLANHAFERPGRLNRLALLHPLIPFEPPAADLSALTVLIAAGEGDPIAPARATEDLAAAYRDRGATVTLHWSEGGHALSPESVEAASAFLAASEFLAAT